MLRVRRHGHSIVVEGGVRAKAHVRDGENHDSEGLNDCINADVFDVRSSSVSMRVAVLRVSQLRDETVRVVRRLEASPQAGARVRLEKACPKLTHRVGKRDLLPFRAARYRCVDRAQQQLREARS